jgi:hypothetical protein
MNDYTDINTNEINVDDKDKESNDETMNGNDEINAP